jgi:molecular chaperone GrpE (heat shock protein)
VKKIVKTYEPSGFSLGGVPIYFDKYEEIEMTVNATIQDQLHVIEECIDNIEEEANKRDLEQDDVNAIVDLMEKSEEKLVALLSKHGVEFGDERVD